MILLNKSKYQSVSLSLLHTYLCGLREFGFSKYLKENNQKDLLVFLKLSDKLENLPELNITNLELLEIKNYILTLNIKEYKEVIQQTLTDILELLNKIDD